MYVCGTIASAQITFLVQKIFNTVCKLPLQFAEIDRKRITISEKNVWITLACCDLKDSSVSAMFRITSPVWVNGGSIAL